MVTRLRTPGKALSSIYANVLMHLPYIWAHVPMLIHASAYLLMGTGLYMQPCGCMQRESFPFVKHLAANTLLYLHLFLYQLSQMPSSPRQSLTFALGLCSILQGAKPNEPRDTILIPIIFFRIRLQICSWKVVGQAEEVYPVNGEEGSREQPEKSGVKLTFWKEPSTHSYYWFLSRKTVDTLSPSCWAKGRTSNTWKQRQQFSMPLEYTGKGPHWPISFKYLPQVLQFHH